MTQTEPAPIASSAAPSYDVGAVRRFFPALSARDQGRQRIYLDNPAGTQTPQQTIDRIVEYLETSNANLGSAFGASQRSNEIVDEAHRAMADFFGARSHREVVLGANMTTLTFALSRSIGRLLRAGDEILLSRIEHDANVRPWEIMAEERGLAVKRIDFDPSTGELDLSNLSDLVTERTRFAAIGYASNLLGTINDVEAVSRAVRSAGGLTFVDSVHYAPHGPIDVTAIGCDVLVCSPYKFYGPHLGAMWAREEVLERLPAYKLRAAPEELPSRFETGTQPHELYAGLLGTFDYLEWLGREMGDAAPRPSESSAVPGGRRATLLAAMRAIRRYERELGARLLAGLAAIPRVRIWGVVDPAAFDRRAPTVAITIEGMPPAEAARRLAARGVCVTNGSGYALSVVERLGLADRGGVLRLGLAHYNTAAEVDEVLRVLAGELS
jgi:cysteine desulfurase family protein (TIGR01976 family)